MAYAINLGTPETGTWISELQVSLVYIVSPGPAGAT